MLVAALVLVVAGTAAAATTQRHSISTALGGTQHLNSGGKFTLGTTHRPRAKRFGVTISYDVTVRSKTVLAFAAYPCKSTSCRGQSTSRITLGSGLRHVKFHGVVPVVNRTTGGACVYAQLRDLGPRGKGSGRIVKNGSAKGVALCTKGRLASTPSG